jgi:acetyl esterase/lipase
MTLILEIIAIVLASISAVLSITFFLRLRWPAPVLWFLKLYVSALSPWFALAGLLCIVWGFATASTFIGLVGMYVCLIFITHVFNVTRPPNVSSDFKQAFGFDWEKSIHPPQKKYFLSRRLTLALPHVPEPRVEQNIPFVTVPGTDRKLLCDIWQPNKNVKTSGLAFIYLHGSAFYFLDKDFGTRPFFRHLAAQGHVIMDVAYRLAPETNMMGMVNDVKRAIVWMKENANSFGVDAGRIVIGGGSAGGHLALLAAYTANNPQFAPDECEGKDMSVRSVISLYGSSDLETVYYHTNQHLTTRSIPGGPKKAVPTKMPVWIVKKMGKEFHRLGMDKGFENAGAIAPLLGGHPDQCPETYALFSAATHVHPGCPSTLLIHGEHDIMAPVRSTLVLHLRLAEAHVPTVMHILPQTDHAFDLILPEISPSAHNAIYDVERFLAVQLKAFLKPIHETFPVGLRRLKHLNFFNSQDMENC